MFSNRNTSRSASPFDPKFFTSFKFTRKQIRNYIENSLRDLHIARNTQVLNVKFNYSYTSLVKVGIALVASRNKRTKSVPGHHAKIIEVLSYTLRDSSVLKMADLMRSKRNIDLYAGGIHLSKKECEEYVSFVDGVVSRVRKLIRIN